MFSSSRNARGSVEKLEIERKGRNCQLMVAEDAMHPCDLVGPSAM